MVGDYVYEATNTTRSALRNDLIVLEDRILQTSERVVRGAEFVDESTGLKNDLGPAQDVIARRLLLEDGCYGAADYGECRNVTGAVLRSGLRNAVVSLVRINRGIRLSGPVPDLEAGVSLFMLTQPQTFIGPVIRMGQAVNPYLRDGLELISYRYAQEAERAVLVQVEAIRTSVSIMQVVIGIATAILYWGAPDRLQIPVRAGWQVVGVIPGTVIDSVPGMAGKVKEELVRLGSRDDGVTGNEPEDAGASNG